MNVLIAGGSLMANRTAEALMADHQVVCLRTNDGVDAMRAEQLDVETVIGSPTSPEALRLAHIERTDVFIACAESDEQNIVSCLAAQRMGASRTICVLSSPGFLNLRDADDDLADSLGIDQVVRPGEQLAHEIVRIVTVPGALDARVFADGRVVLLRYSVEPESPITRAPLKRLKLPHGVVLVMVRRGDEMILPRGETQVLVGDKVMAMGRGHAVRELNRFLRRRHKREKHRAAIDKAVFPGGQGGPLMHVIAAKAVSFKEAMSPDFKTYQQQVVKNAQAMAATFIERGIKIVSGGTENHLMLLDLIGKEYSGKDADEALGQANITVNKNAVPNDPRSPFVTSGLRVGTPAITTRGFKEAECRDLANWMCDLLESLENGTSAQVIPVVKEKVLNICGQFPVYGN